MLLYRLLWRSDEDRETAEKRAHKNALMRCFRTYRGVSPLEKPGCNTRDVVYDRGDRLITDAVSQDQTVLDRLGVGKVAYELLPELKELGIVSPPFPSLRILATDPNLDNYILSFQQKENRQ